MNAPDRTATQHSDSLAREIAAQLHAERTAVIAEAEAEAAAIVSAAHETARTRMHAAIVELRREGAQRLARAQARKQTEARMQAQHRATAAIEAAMPLLRDALDARWQDRDARRAWTDAVAGLGAARLHSGAWTVTHPADWPADEQRAFAAASGRDDVTFQSDPDMTAGVVIACDGATLDATAFGLLADEAAIAAHLLCEIEAAS